MKKIITTIVLLAAFATQAQEAPTTGFLLPRHTAAERDALVNPAKGLTIFNTTTNTQELNTGTHTSPVWSVVSTASASGVNVYCDTTSPLTATVFDDELPVVANDNTLKSSSKNTYYGSDGSVWIWNGTTYVSYNINANLSVGQRISVYKTMATSAANGTHLPASGLIELDGLIRVGLNKYDATFYKPYVENISSGSIKITFSSGQKGATSEIRNGVQSTIAASANQGTDSNDIVYWTTSVTETLSTEIILPNGKWYEIQWFAYELGSVKHIYMTAIRKF